MLPDSIRDISKKIVTDENGTPVAVQIDYADWKRIEAEFQSSSKSEESNSNFSSALDMTRNIWTGEEGLMYQRNIRSEWEQKEDESNTDS